MKKALIIVLLFLVFFKFCYAQEKISKDLLYGNLSYGFETNYGSVGFLMGLGYQKNLTKKFIFQTDLHYFTTEIIDNKWMYIKDFDAEERFNRSAFLSAGLGYAVIGKTDKFNITVKGGISLGHFKSKYLRTYKYRLYTDGHGEVIPSSVVYYEENKFVGAYNIGLDFNFPIKKKSFITIGILSYSHDIPLQFLFFPVVTYKHALQKKK